MALTISPAPTYADVVLIDPATQKGKFNPIWLRWFLDLSQQVNVGVGTVTNTGGALTANAFVIGAGGNDIAAVALTGLVQGKGASAPGAITNSSTVGQVLRVTGASTYAWGALDLADSDAITGVLPVANGGTGSATLGSTNTQVLFNDEGALAGNAGFTFTKATGTVQSGVANNGNTSYTVANTHVGASAVSQIVATTNNGSLALTALSTAGGGTGAFISTLTGGMRFDAINTLTLRTTDTSGIYLGTNNLATRYILIDNTGLVNGTGATEWRSTHGGVEAFMQASSPAGGYFGTRTDHSMVFRVGITPVDAMSIDYTGPVRIATNLIGTSSTPYTFNTGSPPEYWAYQSLDITDTKDASGGSGDRFVVGLLVRDKLHSGSIQGGRVGVKGFVHLTLATSASSPNRNYVGVLGQASAGVADNGSSRTSTGGNMFGINGIAAADGDAQYMEIVSAGEFNTFVAAHATPYTRARRHNGINIGPNVHSERGYTVDAAINIYEQTSAGGTWRHGLLFGCVGAAAATFAAPTVVNDGSFTAGKTYEVKVVGTTNWAAIGGVGTVGAIFMATGSGGAGSGSAYEEGSTVLAAYGAEAVNYVFDLRNFTATTALLKSTNLTITDTTITGLTGVTATTFTGALTGNASGSSGSCTGNAATATALQNARTIGETSFDGTANIYPLYTRDTVTPANGKYGWTGGRSAGGGALTGNYFLLDINGATYKIGEVA